MKYTVEARYHKKGVAPGTSWDVYTGTVDRPDDWMPTEGELVQEIISKDLGSTDFDFINLRIVDEDGLGSTIG